MRNPLPDISPQEHQRRQHRVERIARRMGFVGKIEYRHEHTDSGGAQFREGSDVTRDQLLVFAHAFVRDANPNEFSLEAMIAHERGHQLVFRHPKLAHIQRQLELEVEEVLASLIGAIIVDNASDRQALYDKAEFDAAMTRIGYSKAATFVETLYEILTRILC